MDEAQQMRSEQSARVAEQCEVGPSAVVVLWKHCGNNCRPIFDKNILQLHLESFQDIVAVHGKAISSEIAELRAQALLKAPLSRWVSDGQWDIRTGDLRCI